MKVDICGSINYIVQLMKIDDNREHSIKICARFVDDEIKEGSIS